MTNAEYQALGKSKRLLKVYLVDDGERIRQIPIEQHKNLKPSEKELVYSEVFSYDDCMNTLGQAVF